MGPVVLEYGMNADFRGVLLVYIFGIWVSLVGYIYAAAPLADNGKHGGDLPKIYAAIVPYIGHGELASIAPPSDGCAPVCGGVALWIADTRRRRQVFIAL